MTETDVLIVGGGLAGLSLAAKLTGQNRNFLLLEGRDRLGGRILAKGRDLGSFDLGPAWFWPGQPRIARLISQLELTRFDQHSAGDLVFEDEHGVVHRGRGYASMQGSYRVSGGLAALIDALAEILEPKRVFLETAVTELSNTERGVRVATADGQSFLTKRVVLAVPPRIAATFSYVPVLPAETHQVMDEVATWMAGQAKAVAVYDRPFWRENGLSGDAMSRSGPLVEVHDATPADEQTYAVFGFVGVPAQARRNEAALKATILAQLAKLFGPQAARPVAFYLKDWAFDPFTSTQSDLKPLFAHPHYGLPRALSNLWDGRIIFGGTEVAPEFGGYLEGALEAAENAVARLDRITS